MNIQFPRLLRPLWGKVIWRKDPSEKVIYITFDDGPVPEVTPLVLDILEKSKVKATFFCVGENVQKHTDIYAKVVEKGHKVGNHTFNHLKGFSVSDLEYYTNIEKASILIDSELFRPPYGQISLRQIKELKSHYSLIMWDIITHDYNKSIRPEAILKTIKRYTRNGSIVVFHDSIKAKHNVLTVLPKAIEYWKNEGYSFGLL